MAISIVLMAALTLPIPPENSVVWQKVARWDVNSSKDVGSTMATCEEDATRNTNIKLKCFVMERQASVELKTVTLKTGETK